MNSEDSGPQQLLQWFRANKRELPWRADRDPYRVWLSETMLQQTTTTAVIPYFAKFTAKFPTLKSLAEAKESEVLAAWAGLGYYSRARNLHKAAIALHQRKKFPQTYQELIELPGFGPYTARAVASIAFGQKVGVVDGNVIRVFSRLKGETWEWWKNPIREKIQALADGWTQDQPSHEMNQALMELGRTVCTPRSPSCPLCPLIKQCRANKKNLMQKIPLARPRKAKEIWSWEAEVQMRNGRLCLMKNQALPFLKGQWLLPGTGKKVQAPPARFHYRHSITHFDIFVTLKPNNPMVKENEYRWVPLREIEQHVPTSLVHKALALATRFDGDTPQLQPRRLRQQKSHRVSDRTGGVDQRRRNRR